MKNQFIIIGNLIIDRSKLNHDQKIFLNAVEKINEDEGVNIYPRYSGRGMFGETCVGIVCCTSFRFKFRPKNQSVDSMGLDKIVYFRGIPALPHDSYCDHHDLIETITDPWNANTTEEIEEAKDTLRRFCYEELTGRVL